MTDPFLTKLIAEHDRQTYHRSHGNHPWSREETRPCGEPEQLQPIYLGACWDQPGVVNIGDCLAWQRAERPWLLHVWEPLRTKAPATPRAGPFCCYIQTIIFYHEPYIADWPRGGRDRNGIFHPDWNSRGFIQWDQIESRMAINDVVKYRGDLFEIGSGHVIWCGKQLRWWMHHGARRKRAAP
jgi:hypothetical protein